MRCFIFIAVFAISASKLGLAIALSMEVSEIERQLVDHRNSIKQVDMTLSATRMAHGKRMFAGSRINTTYRIFAVGDDLRTDLVKQNKELSRGDGMFTDSRTLVEGAFLSYDDRTTPEGNIVAVRIDPAQSMQSKLNSIPHPKLLGLWAHNFEALRSNSVNSLFQNENWQHWGELSVELIGGRECTKIHYITRGAKPESEEAIQVFAWIDVQRDANPVRIRTVSGSVEDRVDCELFEIEEFGWFPKSISFRRWVRGNLEYEEDIDVVSAVINKPLNSELFTLAGMGVPEGRIVYDRSVSPMKKWEMVDRELAPYTPVEVALEPMEEPPTSTKRWLLAINGIVVGTLALMLLWRKCLPGRT